MKYHIDWQDAKDYIRLSFYRNRRGFDAIMLVKYKDQSYETISIGRFSSNRQVFVDVLLSDFVMKDLHDVMTKVEKYAMISFKYH